MAFLGTLAGTLLSIPLAAMAARNTAPHPLPRHLTRGFIAVCRTSSGRDCSSRQWGLAPSPARSLSWWTRSASAAASFAEAIEDTEPGPQEALRSLGAGRPAMLACPVLPAVLPSWTNTALFVLEKAARSSVVLGLVGAGGIGI